jgi:uncharacterized protein YqjF (DUF2071 family)
MAASSESVLEYFKVSSGAADPWIMHQKWHNLLFAHWPVSIEALRPLIPAGLSLDTYKGEAWLGLIAFRLSGIRLRGFPPVPFTSSFVELNVRTYVTHQGKPGIYFLSLDANNTLAGKIAHAWYRLAYTKASMSLEVHEDGQINFRSERNEDKQYPARFAASYRPTSASYYAVPGSLEYWLTERYRFYTTDRCQRLYSCEVQHDPWPLQRAEAQISENSMATSHQLELPATSPLLHYASTMPSLIGLLKQVL